MEFTTLNSTHEELAEAIRGVWGKKISKECSIVYLGNLIVGIAASTYILEKEVGANHYPWKEIGEGVYLAVTK